MVFPLISEFPCIDRILHGEKKSSREFSAEEENCADELCAEHGGLAEEKRSAAELQRLEPLDGSALVGDDLRLPDDGDGHEAHQENADSEGEVGVGLASREAKGANEPSHVQVS